MANQYFVKQALPELGGRVSLQAESASHHIFKVMRAEAGDKLRLVFEDARVGLVEVTDLEKQEVKLLEVLEAKQELPLEVTVAVGFPKGDKLDFIVEKTTELGAKAIWAAPFKWSVAKWDAKKLAKKSEKLEKIALGAAEQSMRLQIPEIQLFENFRNLSGRLSEFDSILVAYEESAKSGEMTVFAQALEEMPKRLLLIFGPEGGISEEEIQLFEAAGARTIGLGPRILRAETAPLYALSAISAYYELFH
ncbi:16S rRNA (uracil(1498)-N(3))-methyltransferase [Lactococcus termiticola]|uniref:Ribosomal RNA small subunit methyltransferase E n=1 Tax=Lactococcus termiticola TaxID=2169526 RepID=A0A2R5HFY8_9LACT|nr:16S rRNA (uracil(1498)-N(3))-methyltransferase [Lactococcus termiticola]GBG96912.1 16S rRNA methyltransferase [Lactococcus termiticola]